MEEHVRKELEAIKGMVLAWRRDYLRGAPSEGGEVLAGEFLEEIDTHVYPYVRRLVECNYLTGAEARQVLEFCYHQVAGLRADLGGAEVEQLPAQGG